VTVAAARVLAVDGGQSAVRVRLSSGGSAIAPGVSWGGTDTLAAVATTIIESWRAAGARPVDTAVLGLTTVPGDRAACARLAELVSDGVGVDRVVVCDDGITSHAGAFHGGWGIALSVGTGVACALRGPGDSTTRLIGGHGFLLGDEGGAYWIGRAGLGAALRAADGRGPGTLLVRAAEAQFGALSDMPIRIHSSDRAVDEIAQFAPTVLAAADDDPVAMGIVNAAVSELALVARAAREGMGASDRTPFVILGRLGAELRPRIVERLRAEADDFDPRSPLGDALDGAFVISQSGAAGLYTWERG
jgi:N-acetylglucosamine kinase-like BadF-type ATPase